MERCLPAAYYTQCKLNGPGVGTLSTNGAISQGEWWWDGHPETGLYNHVMTPNLWSCDDSNNSWVNDGAGRHGQQPSPRRGECHVLRRFSQGDQVIDQFRNLVGPGHSCWRRSRIFRLVLTRATCRREQASSSQGHAWNTESVSHRLGPENCCFPARSLLICHQEGTPQSSVSEQLRSDPPDREAVHALRWRPSLRRELDIPGVVARFDVEGENAITQFGLFLEHRPGNPH